MSEPNISQLVASLDSEDMLGFLRQFPSDFMAQMAQNEEMDTNTNVPRNLLCLGMGGSAAAGDFLASLANYDGNSQVTTWRNYGLPNWTNSEVNVVATSYSGNTEETLDGVAKAVERNLSLTVISSGGKLSTYPNHISVPSGQPPRSAFGHLFGALLRNASMNGVVNYEELTGLQERLQETVEEFDFVNNPDSPTLSLAQTMIDKEIGIVTAHELDCAGTRFVNQLNENGGVFARSNTLPEMNHNEIIAWTEEAAKQSQTLIFLTWSGMHERTAKRVEWMMDNVDVEIAWQLHCEGESLLEAMLYSCIAMDWISCAVAILRGKDPSAIGAIRNLKEFLSE
ncbi:MAG: hypothetical protein HOE69_08425 [Euryarchaeota archaeon]|jgi:glucose/mannose-6-phosphate isomerase|nr:hypothetical protein [Euryarchaeota archaeon]